MKAKPFALFATSLLTTALNLATIPPAFAAWSSKDQNKLNTAVDFVFTRKEKEKYRVIKHKWNFQNKNDIKIQRTGATVRATGKFTHYLRFVRDDVVDYEIILKNGKIDKVDMKYTDKGWSHAARWGVKTAKFIYDLYKEYNENDGADQKKLNARLKSTNAKLNEKLHREYDGSVQSEAQVIIANIAARLQEQELRAK